MTNPLIQQLKPLIILRNTVQGVLDDNCRSSRAFLANFYCREHADKHKNLWFLRCVNKRLSPCGSTATLTMLWRNSSSIAGQTSENCLQFVKFTIYITFVTCCHYYNHTKQQLTFSIVVTLKGLIFFTYSLAKLFYKSNTFKVIFQINRSQPWTSEIDFFYDWDRVVQFSL